MRPLTEAGTEIRVLGPFEVWVDGRRLDLGGARRRTLLGVLVLERNRVVSTDRLKDEIWGERPPPTAAKAIQNLVVHVRKTLVAARGVALETQPPGYVLRVADELVDAHRFEALATQGAGLVEADPARADTVLREALELWKGDALADFAYDAFAQGETARLEELRLAAIEDRIDARLALGREEDLVAELEALAARHPARERLQGQLMLSLYRNGRQTEALEVYQRLRTRLQDELGLEPGPRLRQLQQAILTQDAALDRPRYLPGRTRRRRRSLFVVAFALVALVGGAALGAGAVFDQDAAPTVVPDSVVKIDAESNEIRAVIRVGKDPGQLALAGEHVFVASQQDGTLTRIHRDTDELTTSGRFDASGSVSVDRGSVWVVSTTRGSVARVSAASLDSDDEIRLASDPHHILTFIDVGGSSLWTSEWFPPVVSRWNLQSLDRVWRYGLGDAEYPLEVSFGLGAAWVALWTTNRILRIDAINGRRAEFNVGGGPRDPTVGFGSLWVAMAQDRTVWRIAPHSRRPRAVFDVGGVPWGLAVNGESVWVSDNCGGTVTRIDPETNRVVATIRLGFSPQWLVADDEHVWVGVGETSSGVPAAGPAVLALPACR